MISKQIKENNYEKKIMKKKVDIILDKLNKYGWSELTKEEEHYLNHASKKLFDNKNPN